MFGLSFAEIAVILLVGVMVIGPKELPMVIRAVVRTLGQFRNVANEFRSQFDMLAKETEIQAIKDEIMTARPTIIDLEGNTQPTFDISEEQKTYRQKHVAVKEEERV